MTKFMKYLTISLLTPAVFLGLNWFFLTQSSGWLCRGSDCLAMLIFAPILASIGTVLFATAVALYFARKASQNDQNS